LTSFHNAEVFIYMMIL